MVQFLSFYQRFFSCPTNIHFQSTINDQTVFLLLILGDDTLRLSCTVFDRIAVRVGQGTFPLVSMVSSKGGLGNLSPSFNGTAVRVGQRTCLLCSMAQQSGWVREPVPLLQWYSSQDGQGPSLIALFVVRWQHCMIISEMSTLHLQSCI